MAMPLSFLTQAPDDVLSEREVQKEKFCTTYLLPHVDHNQDHALVMAIRRDLTQNLRKTQADVFNTMREAIDTSMGMDDASWHEINLFGALQDAIFRAMNVILVGAPLCHDASYQDALSEFAIWLGGMAVFIGQYMPWFLTPILGHLAWFPVEIYRRKAQGLLLPLCEERVNSMQSGLKALSDEPKDLITWIIQRTAAPDPLKVAEIILSLTLAAVHTTIITATNVILDLASSTSDSDYYRLLREEAASVFRTPEDWVCWSSLRDLTLVDSAIRESLRLNSVAGRVMRQVMVKEGLTLPGGQHLPQNAWVGVSIVGINRDSRFYKEADQYRPFRHAKRSTLEASSAASGTDDTTKAEANGAYLATTSDTFMSFGHGQNACPGRWFAGHILQLMVAYITLNYDIQPLGHRPVNLVFGDSIFPPRGTTIKVRRRKSEVPLV
ncbi:MAG: hypothetical protein Q9182_007066 [Xanthomendoza sp. 2 TL-2023]